MGRKAAEAGHAKHAVALGQPLDPFAHRIDDTGNLSARCEGTRRLHLVHVADDQRVGKVHTGGMDAHPHLLLAGLRVRQLFEHECFRAADLFAEHRFHGVLPKFFCLGNLRRGVVSCQS